MTANLSEIAYTVAASLSSAGIMLGAGYRLFDALLEKKLLKMESGILDRINGTYVRRMECSLLHRQSETDYQHLHSVALELKAGMSDIRKRIDILHPAKDYRNSEK